MGVGDVAAWMAKEVVAPELFARGVEKLGDRPVRAKLTARVKERTEHALVPSYGTWLKDPATRQLLEAQSSDAYDRLVESLMNAERADGREPNFDDVDQQVTLTIVCFLESLDAATAVAIHELRDEGRHLVSEQRADERHDAVLSGQAGLRALMTPDAEMARRLRGVFPEARAILERNVPRDIQVKVLHVVESDDPKQGIAGLVRLPPVWFTDPSAPLLMAVAELAAGSGLWSESATAFEQAGDAGTPDRQYAYVRAAHSFGNDTRFDDADRCLDKARELGPCPLADALFEARESLDGIVDVLDEATAQGSPLGALLYAEGLIARHDSDAAITFLEGRIAAWPEQGAVGLRLARILLERSLQATAVDAGRDRSTAAELALRVRDARREWNGNAVEAVEVACQALLILGSFEQVIRVGRTPPHGEASAEEAASTEVGFAVVQSSIARGDLKTAGEIAAAASGFDGALLVADVLFASDGDSSEIERLYREAWDLAEDDRQKHTLWIGASQAGIEPLPGEAELDQDPDFALLIRATNEASLGRSREAIAMLRPVHTEHARQAIVRAYLLDDQVGAAVDELRDMFARFNQAEYLTRAVNVLAKPKTLQAAANLAVQALGVLPGNHPDRSRLHEVCIASAFERSDWPEVERHARATLSEQGRTDRLRWTLALALLQQSKLDLAWAALQDGGVPAVETSNDAQLWIILHAQFSRGPEVVARALELAEQFPGDREVRRVATSLWITAGDDRGDVQPTDVARWQRQLELREAHPGERDSFQTIRISDDPDEMVEVFRDLLEPQAALIEEWTDRVAKDGLPLGVLALAGGRPYCLTVAARPLGFSPIGSADPATFEAEVEAAHRALDGVVVADLSSVLTGWYIKEFWTKCVAAFRRVEVAQESRRDLTGEVHQPQMTSQGTIGWDLRSGRPTLHDPDHEAIERLREHLAWSESQLRGMSDHQSQPESDEDRRTAWGDSVAIAETDGLPLWVDDAGLRAMAQASGVPAFGTHALLAALERAGHVASGTTAEALTALRSEYCVDLPFDRSWMVQNAREVAFLGGPALATFARRSAWQHPAEAFEVWQTIVGEAGDHDPMLVGRWVYAAATGILHLFSPGIAVGESATVVELVARLTSAGVLASQDPPAVRVVLDGAAEACDKAEVQDPARTAFVFLLEQLSAALGPAGGAQQLATLCAEVSDAHRDLLREVLFPQRHEPPAE